MNEAVKRQAVIAELCKTLRWVNTDYLGLYYMEIAEEICVHTTNKDFFVNVAGDGVVAMLCHVMEKIREYEEGGGV